MQQRRLRLGDIVDDYCPRERRITNHAIVAMIEDEVKQTRCTTCDADHEYKQARVPAQRRKKDSPSGLPAEGVARARRKRPAAETGDTVTGDTGADAIDAAEAVDSLDVSETVVVSETPLPETGSSEASSPQPAGVDQQDVSLQTSQAVDAEAEPFDATVLAEPPALAEDEGPVHRRLIRATLPRPEGQAPERKLPDFTMHQREANGNRAGRPHRRGPRSGQLRTQQQGIGQPSRFGGPRQGPRHGSGSGHGGGGQGQPGGGRSGHGTGQGQPGPHRHNRHGGGRKRGR